MSLHSVEQAAAEVRSATAALHAEVAAAHAAGVPIAAIARAAGISRPTAHAWIRDVSSDESQG